MTNEYELNIYDFDIYSKRISFFYDKRDKVGTVFGLILTFLYAVITLVLFLYYLIKIVKRSDVKSHELTLYSQGLPSININPNLFYFAFGLENPLTLSRYINESIYYPKVYFIKQEKENGIFITKETIPLGVERCDALKFGKEYQSQFTLGEIENSYCLKDFNLLLVGGSKYNQSSFIQIKTHPCVNTTENHNHCLPQNIIDSYLTSGYFSIVVKDIGLNPLNYSFPIIPIVQNLKTNVDKTMCRESLIYVGIAQIMTDVGIFSNLIKTETFLQYRKYSQSFYFINETEYHEGKEIFAAQIKLEEYIHVQKREYAKMSEAFSITGGYMQLISTIFVLIRLFSKNISMDKKVINKLFSFNIKKRRILLDIKYDKKLNYSIHLDKGDINSFVPFAAKKTIYTNKKESNIHNHNIINGITKIKDISFQNLDNNFDKKMKNIPLEFINKSDKYNNRIKKNTEKKLDFNKIIENNKTKANVQNMAKQSFINRSNIGLLFKDEEIGDYKKIRISKKKLTKKVKESIIHTSKGLTTNAQFSSPIDFNILQLLCCFEKFKIPSTNLELYNFGVNFYKNQLNIVHIFNLLFILETKLNKHSQKYNNIFNQIVEIPLK